MGVDSRARGLLFCLAVALGASSCDRSSPETTAPARQGGDDDEARLDRFEAHATEDDQEIARLEVEAAQLTADVREISRLFRQVNADYKRATQILNHAAKRFDRASQEYTAAADSYREASKHWRIVAATIMVAATSDMAVKFLCDGRMTRAQVRKHWKSQGLDLEGVDADHIWPKSRGGADHLWNFQRMESSLNRSLGNDIWWKIQNQPLDMLRGAAVSALMRLQCK